MPPRGAASSGERELTKGVCYCCKTALAAGPRGLLVAAWRHVYPGNLRDIAFTVSRDHGRTFSPPVRVSEDGWAINACPDDGPAIGVDGRGTVHLAWRTVIGGANPEGALFYASTSDGRTFTPRVRIPTLGAFNPTHPQLVESVDGRGRIVGGVGRGGRWAAGRRGTPADREIGQHVDFAPIVTLSSDGPAMYPALATTERGLLAVWPTVGETSVIRARTIRRAVAALSTVHICDPRSIRAEPHVKKVWQRASAAARCRNSASPSDTDKETVSNLPSPFPA